MTPWEQIVSGFSDLAGSAAAIVMAALGTLARLLHIQEQGGPTVTWWLLLVNIPAVMALGVVSFTLGVWLHDAYAVPQFAGAALGAVLGYLGIGVLNLALSTAVKRLRRAPQEPPEKD